MTVMPGGANILRVLVALLLVNMAAGCASTTQVRSNPPGAVLYVDNIRQCTTPCSYTDSSTIFTPVKAITLKKAGYKDLETVIRKTEPQVGPIVGGVFVGVPLLWALGYPSEYTFELATVGKSGRR